MTRFEIIKNNKGMATFIALMIMLMLTMIGVAVLKIADDEITIAGNEMNEMASFYAAEAGLERASAAIQAQYTSTGGPPSVLPSGSEYLNSKTSVAFVTSDLGAAVQRTLSKETLAGLHALVKTFEIEAIGTSSTDGSQVRLTQQFEAALVPIFQFAVFYDNDLEIAPGADMTLAGRVHTNGDLWLQAYSNLNMDSYVTCAGNLFHGRKGAGGVDNGNVFIKDTDGNYRNMKNPDNSFLESTDSYWYDSASTRWGGRVQDAAFGQKQLSLPLNSSGDAHKLIERGSGNTDSYEHKADIKIIDGAVYAQVGSVWQDITAVLPSGTVTNKTFYDGREGTNVNATEIDMSKLVSSGYYPGGGVVYASDQSAGTFNALRMTNGANLGQPLSVYSENPIYVEGDFNSINKQPVSLAGDAVTFLSNSWDDSKSTLNKDFRVATPTICNASVMTGNTNTTSTNYNGGFENLPRFLEKWDAVKFTWQGSMINLWNSQQAVGDWNGTYYSPPIRDWAYDTDLDDPSKLPPETPMLRIFQRTGWKQDQVGYTSTPPPDSTIDP
jgi:Tfp pilus assembly protein PilX